jgi:hypothetical protein
MVTAELAVAILAALSLLVTMCWGVLVVVMQLRCVDVAAAVARQEARQDVAAAAAARRQAPAGAVVRVERRRAEVTVTVALTVRPFLRGPVAVPLHAEATVAREPDAGPR